MKQTDSCQWDDSQSGRRKQNFGPKVNFKKKKITRGNFNGFPAYTKFVQDKFKDIPVLSDFKTIELCFLEYEACKGASIDPHIDDCWIWGERVLTVNLLSDSVLTLTKYSNTDHPEKYNLDLVEKYKDSLIEKLDPEPNDDPIVLRVPMPR
jgi:alkylated DNA repair protein alkB family protein 4